MVNLEAVMDTVEVVGFSILSAWQIHWRLFLMTNESTLERALQSTWDAKERFYEENKGLTIRQILEKRETPCAGRKPVAPPP
jgi:hypothetical protein